MNEHTPGPWRYERSQHHAAVYLIDYSTKDIGGSPHYAAMGEIRSCEADARLIAAAPEMLSMLRVFLNRMDQEVKENPERSFPGRTYIEDLRALISKASA